MHYAVLVLLDKNLQSNDSIRLALDRALSPFDESLEVEPYIECTKEKIIEKAKSYKEYILSKNEPASSYYLKFINAKSDEELYNAYIDEDTLYDINGNELSTYNPNSKWDWYTICGRYGGIPLKDGNSKGICRLKDIDLSVDKKEYAKCEKIWDIVINDVEPQILDEQIEKAINPKEWVLSQFKTKEGYCKVNSIFHTYAILTLDGKWLEKEESSLEWLEKFIDILENTDQDSVAVIVDVHI